MTDQEINEAVARKLGVHLGHTDPVCYCGRMEHVDPDFCHSIAAAWEIVDFLSVVTYIYRPSVGGKEWHVDFGDGIFEADTAPMAICLAFLKLPNG